MAFKQKRYLRFFLALVICSGLSFYIGMKYEQVSQIRQENLMFANILGDELVNVNRLMNSIDQKKKADIIKDYNRDTLSIIGCSFWLDDLDHFKEKDKLYFNQGIDVAFEKISAEEKPDSKCIKKIRKIYELRHIKK